MAFTGNFSVSQTAIGNIVITDTSDYGSEGAGTFSGRQIRLYKIDGTTLVPDGTTTSYINFPFTDGNTITLSNILLQDLSLSINLVWVSTNPQPGSTYTKTTVNTFLNYLKQFRYELVQDLAAQPTLINDVNWSGSLRNFQNEIKSAESATDYADQFSAQAAIDRAYVLKNNQNFYF